MENDALKTIQNNLLYSNKKVSLPTGRDWRKHYTTQTQNVERLTEQMKILKIDLTNFLINFRMNIIT